jgi:hypothetical protein
VRPSQSRLAVQAKNCWSSHGFPTVFARGIAKARVTRAPEAASDASAVKVGTAIRNLVGPAAELVVGRR